MKAFLAARSIFFVALLPGTVAGYVPFRLLHSGQLRWPALSLSACLAALTTLVGAVVLLAPSGSSLPQDTARWRPSIRRGDWS
jgi:hypothetical protein